MTAVLMKGAGPASRIRAQVAEDVAELGHVGLATVLVGNDPASEIYVGHKHRAALEAGMASHDERLSADASEGDLLAVLERLNGDDAVDGILVQLPVPRHFDEGRVLSGVDERKDVDGFNPASAGRLYLGRPTFLPATPAGIMVLLDEHGVEIEGRHAVVVGRSQIVGKPIAHLLLGRNATVTICHSRTPDLGAVTREAEILVVGVGVAHLVGPDMVKPGAAVVDVGITRTDEGLAGDVHPDVADVAGWMTPVPGGVGPMTIALLLANTVQAARYRRHLLAFP
jgi:methylenetetrahydrofolate dehydrogenase (NADP+) / methenyltetrahydrofolate cyclohydrolase